MADRTLTALYSTRNQAEDAKERLKDAGISGMNIDIHDEREGSSAGGAGEGFMDKLKGFFGGHDDHQTYAEGVRRGNVLLTAKVDDDEVDTACRVLESTSALDVDTAEQEWRGAGDSPMPYASSPAADVGDGSMQTERYARGQSGADEQAIPLVEERVQVGKREVNRGGVRVRSYVVEEPVHEQVTLREEHVSVERRPVNRPVSDVGDLLQEREIELTETAEEAVIAKDAVIREEVVLRKETGERVESIDEEVRRTEVEIDDRTGRRVEDRDRKPLI